MLEPSRAGTLTDCKQCHKLHWRRVFDGSAVLHLGPGSSALTVAVVASAPAVPLVAAAAVAATAVAPTAPTLPVVLWPLPSMLCELYVHLRGGRAVGCSRLRVAREQAYRCVLATKGLR